MRMSTTLRQGNQIGERSRTTARNEQRRVVTTTHLEGERTIGVRVQYLEATKHLAASEAAAPRAVQTEKEESSTEQPVAGKTYECRREPGKVGKLTIKDVDGNIPPINEYEIVAQHMEMVGRANPLVDFLAGQSIEVGQTLELPKAIAGKVFNLGEQLGEVDRFTLTLEKIERMNGEVCAVFVAHIDATSSNASQMRLELKGTLIVEADTCRALKVDLSGPIAMSETRGSYSTSYQVIGTGQLQMSTLSNYQDATP